MISEKDKYNFKSHVEAYDHYHNENHPRLELFDESVANFKFVNCNMKQFSCIHGQLENIYFINCEIEQSEFRLSTFKNCHFRDTHFKNTIFAKTEFINCTFENCSLESQYPINSEEFLKFNHCYLYDLDLAKAQVAPDFMDMITSSVCGNLTVQQNAVSDNSNIIMQRQSKAAAPTPSASKPKPKASSTPAAKKPAPPAKDGEIKKIGDTEKAPEAGSFNDRFSGIEFNKKKADE